LEKDMPDVIILYR